MHVAPAEMPVTTGTQEQTVKTEPENHGCSFDTYVSINTISFRKLYSNFLAERFFRSMTRDTDIGSLSRYRREIYFYFFNANQPFYVLSRK